LFFKDGSPSGNHAILVKHHPCDDRIFLQEDGEIKQENLSMKCRGKELLTVNEMGTTKGERGEKSIAYLPGTVSERWMDSRDATSLILSPIPPHPVNIVVSCYS
jgi:hypothetical protein